MASSDDLQFPFDFNSFLFLDLPETFSALTECRENPSLLVSENEQNEDVGYAPVSAASNDVNPSSLIENSSTDQETLTGISSFDQDIVTQNQSFHHEDDYSKYLKAAEKFPNMSSCRLHNGQRESVHSEKHLLTSTNTVMTNGLELIGHHGFVNQSCQQPSLSQTFPNFSMNPYASTMMGSDVQEGEIANGLTYLNPIYGLQDLDIHQSLFQEEQYDHDLLLDQLNHIHENDEMQQPYLGALLSTQQQIPYDTSSNTIPAPEYRTTMIANNHIIKTSENYSPFAHTSFQSDPFAFNSQNSSSLKTTRRTRGRPRKNQTLMPLVPTTQTLLTSPRTQEKGKQAITEMSSLNPTLYNQYQNSYTNTMIQQSGVLKQRSCYDQLENECSSSKMRRIMLPLQEKTIADSSTVSFWQDGNMSSSAANDQDQDEDRLIKNTMYDPLYAGVGLPMDPHLRRC